MRIVGGRSRGLKLAEVETRDIRPTTDRTREALFNILAHDPDLRSEAGPFPAGARVADVFAGTGALGLEAYSRGAAHVSFIEKGGEALKILKANIAKLKAGGASDILERDALSPGPARRRADLVLMDPPYGENLTGRALTALNRDGWIGPDTVIVVETDKRDAVEAPPGFEVTRQRDYGRTRLHFLRLL
ncbi:MAG: 16S rRNA (guanine(966)-N(2))-methyltransferase RsmD [Minwuia sp.]|uniref:16S rRNA (guanine(966)-N(2))-methyltransferase RsmD n=1 Tax=Minwuia sp. TaxID=2493630 RepID=UPI003A842C60